jgi:hypothetical protein
MVIKYTNIYHSKAFQNFTKIGIFGLKTNHLATLLSELLAILCKRQFLKEEVHLL